ncbi:hypothetical protein [Pasteuria penetrans]|uniref:hypothetical protein n=1 Tax=Pasteuria penetrans TaxID=86005 RepID=UPI000FB398C6|nr:hypothetical protein [Pasteuria penetrans]
MDHARDRAIGSGREASEGVPTVSSGRDDSQKRLQERNNTDRLRFPYDPLPVVLGRYYDISYPSAWNQRFLPMVQPPSGGL